MYIDEILKMDEYKELFNKNNMKKTVFYTLGGSHAYGTNVEGSDIDVRGIWFNTKENILLGKDFEQILFDETDVVIYSFDKILRLLTECNPNTIEMVGNKFENYIFGEYNVGKELIKNYDMFLSQKAIKSFSGYAEDQLRRLQNAIARDGVDEDLKEEHILNSVKKMMSYINEKYKINENGSVKLYIDKATSNSKLKNEIYISGYIHHYPLRDYKNMFFEFQNVLKQYGKLGKRNHKKDEAHLQKHMMHLIRLYFMAFDIVKEMKVNTYREREHNLLMNIRNGKYMEDDNYVKKEFFTMLDKMKILFDDACKNTSLPEYPDYERIDKFRMDVNEKIVSGEIIF